VTDTLVATPDPEDGDEPPIEKLGHQSVSKKFRKVKVLPSEDGQFYYIALDKKGEPLYTSETFTRKSSAINAARREHEGRNERFDYILEYENSRGSLVRETL
jgi:hypothetical protein